MIWGYNIRDNGKENGNHILELYRGYIGVMDNKMENYYNGSFKDYADNRRKRRLQLEASSSSTGCKGHIAVLPLFYSYYSFLLLLSS